MQYNANSPAGYIRQVPAERKPAMEKLRERIKKNLPSGFEETMSYGMIGYVVPHSIFPSGYHCDPKLPLPFMSIASQKNFIAVYHMGIYTMPALMDWFVNEYRAHYKAKLDMGKSCMRFKKPGDIPYDLIGDLASKISVQEWIDFYQNSIKR